MAFKTVRMPGVVEVADPGNGGQIVLPEHHNAVCAVSSSSGSNETRTIAVPSFHGQRCTLSMDTDAGGNVVINVAGDGNTQGHDEISFTAIGQAVDMVGVKRSGALRWRAAVADPTSILA